MSQVRLGRNDTKPPAPGLEDLFYSYGTVPNFSTSCTPQRGVEEHSFAHSDSPDSYREQSKPKSCKKKKKKEKKKKKQDFGLAHVPFPNVCPVLHFSDCLLHLITELLVEFACSQ